MTLLAPIALGTIALVAAVAAAATVVAYILKMRRRRFEVPFSTLWQRVLREKEATALWKHLRRLLSLALALVTLALLLFAATEPRLGEADDGGRSVVFVIDTSASMEATDGGDGRRRIDAALARARELVGGLGGGDRAMAIRMDGQTTPISRFGGDMPALRRQLADVEPTDTPADLGRALAMAADALHGRPRPTIVLIGDGAYDADALAAATWAPAAAGAATVRLDAIDLSGVDVRFEPIGERGDNVGIVAFNARRYLANKLAYEIFIEVENFGTAAARRKLVLYAGDTPIDVRALELRPGERLRQIYPDQSGGEGERLRAVLQPATDGDAADAFPTDDVAHALLPARKRQDVLLVTRDNLYLEGAMLVYDDVRVDKLTPEAYDAAIAGGTLPAYAAVVFDDHTPAALPPEPTHLLYFHPSGPASPFPIVRRRVAPRVTDVVDHPVTRWLVLDDVNFDAADVFAVDRAAGGVALVSALRDPIVAARRDGRRKIVAAGFGLAGTDLTLRVAFPLLLVNTLDWFAGDEADLLTTYRTGARVELPFDGGDGATPTEVEITAPSGRRSRAAVVDGLAGFQPSEVGVHTVTERTGGATIALAANLADPRESAIAPARTLALGGRALTDAGDLGATGVGQALWRYLALAVLALLFVEWLTYHRRVTV